MAANDPSTTSGDYDAMAPFWAMVSAILGGLEAMRAAGEDYLPRFEGETVSAYGKRRANARLTNIFAKSLTDLSMRPFTKALQLGPDTTEQLSALTDDIDGRGNNLHEFAEDLFYQGVGAGVTWILVDQPQGVPAGATIADERRLGVRPYWRHYLARDVLAVYTKFRQVDPETLGADDTDAADLGVEVLDEIRLREVSIEREGFDEKTVERVRVFRLGDGDRPEWELWRKRETKTPNPQGGEWDRETGPHALPLSRIPMVPVVFGKRIGTSWRLEPPLRDAAHLQVELYQQENGLKNIRNLTAYPMLAGNGINPDIGEDSQPRELIIGPNTVLYGGTTEQGSGSWAFVEPTGTSLRFLSDDIKDTIMALRELCRQPLITPAPNLTVVSAAESSQTSNTAAQAWVATLTDGLHLAGQITAEWMDLTDYTFEVVIHNDFDAMFQDDDTAHLITMASGELPLISREAFLAEMQRRGVLSPAYDAEADLAKLAGVAGEDGEGP